MDFTPFLILIGIHFLVMMHCAQYMRRVKDQKISEGMEEQEADDFAKADYKAGLSAFGHPMFKIGLYNYVMIAAVLFCIYKFTPLFDALF